MKKTGVSTGLALALVLVKSASAQKKEQERVENAGTVMQEILNAPAVSRKAYWTKRTALLSYRPL
jgi:hypothetical protein